MLRVSRATRKLFLYSQGDYEGLNSELEDLDWDSTFHRKSLQQCWDRFKDIYETLINTFIPHKFVKPGTRNGPPWTRYKSLTKAKRRRRQRWVDYKKSDLEADKILCHQETANVTNAIFSAKSHHENKLINQIKDDPKRFWNYTRHFSRSSSTVDMLEH